MQEIPDGNDKIQNNMKSYLRFLSRNKLYTAIMVVGLSVSLAFVIIMGCFTWQQYSVGRHYPEFERTYCLRYANSTFSSLQFYHIIEDRIPEIDAMTALVSREGMIWTDAEDTSSLSREEFGVIPFLMIMPNWFDMLPCRFVHGSKEVLNDVNNAIVTESFAEMFGGKSAIGKTFHISNVRYTIAAIIEDIGSDSILNGQYRVFVNRCHPNEARLHNTDTFAGGAEESVLTILRFKEGTDIIAARKKINEINDSYMPAEFRGSEPYSFIRMDDIYLSDAIHGPYLKQGSRSTMTAFGIIALFVLVSAIFNYINLSSALAGKRAKEMATRMLLGDTKANLTLTRIAESMLMTAICMCFAFLIAKAVLPFINSLVCSQVPITIGWDLASIVIYLSILLAVGIVCGLLPGLIAFRFKPIDTLKGSFRYSSKKTFSKIFIILQNSLAIIMVAVSIVMSCQIKHMTDMPLNANIDGLYKCEAKGANIEFEQKLASLPYVSEVGKVYGTPGQCAITRTHPLDDTYKDYVYTGIIACDTTAFRLFDFKIIHDFGITGDKGIWLTERAVRELNIDVENQILPSSFDTYEEGNYQLAGIIEDFALRSAINIDNDMCGVVYVNPSYLENSCDYIVKMVSPTDENKDELYALSKERAVELFGPNVIVNSGMLKDLIDSEYAQVENQLILVTIFMVIAIMLAVLGQVAMSTYFAREKEQEIGIRKVFGGTVRSESIRIICEYMLYCLIATVIAIPAACFIAARYLEGFQYRMEQNAWIYIASSLSVFAVSLLAVLWQTLRAARTNPAEALKKE